VAGTSSGWLRNAAFQRVIWVEKACACVVRREHLLLFRHPTAGVQIPKGGIERGELAIDAAVRELREESGLSLTAAPSYVSTLEFERPPKRGVHGGKVTWQRWILFRFDTDETLPERWQHAAIGGPDEDGLIFDFFWHPLDRSPTQMYPGIDARYVAATEEIHATPR